MISVIWKKAHLLMVIFGASGSAVFGNLLALVLAAMIPATIQFPTVNGGVVILYTFSSVLIYKERLFGKGIADLCAGITALLLLSVNR